MSNKLDEEFKEEIKSKVAEASEALKAANKIARDNNTWLYELYYDVGCTKLFDQLEQAGWQTSSMRC